LKDSPFFSVARIIKTQGNRGEVAADILTDFPERFRSLREVTLEKQGQPTLSLRLDSHWFHKKRVVLKFQDIDGMTPAEKLIGYEVRIPKSELTPLNAGTYYQHDLVGCAVEGPEGSYHGRVVEVLGESGNFLLRVGRDRGDFLIPFAASYFRKIDIQNKLLICDLPEGLEDL
jgi:16S rRNA processing protein RimM